MSGVHVFDPMVDDANVWLKAVMAQLETDDTRLAAAALRAVLHALRDRLPPESAVHLGAQLPTVVRGIFYEGWQLSREPARERHMSQFLAHVGDALPSRQGTSAEDAARAVLAVLSDMVDRDEVTKVVRMLPRELRDVWPILVQVDAAETRHGEQA